MREPRCLGARRIWICNDAFKRVSAETCFDALAEFKSDFIAEFFTRTYLKIAKHLSYW
jgi:hypothetical protein